MKGVIMLNKDERWELEKNILKKKELYRFQNYSEGAIKGFRYCNRYPNEEDIKNRLINGITHSKFDDFDIGYFQTLATILNIESEKVKY